MRVTAVLVLVLALTAPAVATAQEETPPGIETTKGVTEPTYENSVTEQYYVETDHGTIYGEVIRPLTDDGKDVTAPVILTYSPYNIIGSPTNQTGSIADDNTAAYFVPRGYARAVFDVVGTRESSGCYDYGGLGERETGAAVVDFLGTQPWANGKVGMIGGSYDGTTAIAAAVQAPKHLTTIVPQVAIDRWYDYAFGGGVRYFLNNENPTDEGFDTPLAFDFGFGFLPPADVTNPEQYAAAVGTRINPCERIQHTERAYEYDPVYDEFWEERDYRRLADQVTASVFIEGGWLDHNVKHWDSTRFFMALPEDHPKKLVMGQWRHSANRFADAQDLRHAWFDHWLMGLDTGVMELPAVDTQLNTQTGTQEREQEPTWPPPGTSDVALDLLLDKEEPAVGELAVTTGNSSWTDENGAPVTEEEMFSGPTSDRFIRLLSAPLESDVRISGSPLLDQLLSSSAAHTQFTPVLYEQTPEGEVHVITRGFLNVRNRNGLDVSEPAPVDELYQAPVEMWDVDYLVKAGNQLGLVMASDNADWALDDDDPTGTNTPVFGDQAARASVLRLPVSLGHEALGASPGACNEAFMPDTQFRDIAGNVHRDNIACIAWYLITQGTSASTYSPTGSVTRGQMASYLARLAVDGGVRLPSSPPDAFNDDNGTTHERNINALAALDLVEGTSGRRYSPRQSVTRDQMASFIARLHERVTGSLPSDPPDAFTDDDGNVHEPSINALAALGVVYGLRDRDDDGQLDYFPGRAVLRDQMATFVINDLRLFIGAGKAHAGGASVTLTQAQVPQGGTVQGTVASNKRLVSLIADGCGVDRRPVSVGDQGGFSVKLPDSQASGKCELRLTPATTNRDANGETQRITYARPVTVE